MKDASDCCLAWFGSWLSGDTAVSSTSKSATCCEMAIACPGATKAGATVSETAALSDYCRGEPI